MKPSDILAAKADAVREIIARYPVRNPRVFGSVARGEDREGSDLDLLVEPDESTSFYDLVDLEAELQEVLGIKVEVTTPNGLARDVAARVAADLRPL